MQRGKQLYKEIKELYKEVNKIMQRGFLHLLFFLCKEVKHFLSNISSRQASSSHNQSSFVFVSDCQIRS